MTVSANGGQGYCMTAQSQSGKYFGYSSSTGPVSKATAISSTTCT